MQLFGKDKDGQFKFKTEAFSAKTAIVNGAEMSLYKRIHGKKYASVPAGVVTELDFAVPYPLAKIETIEIINGALGDSVTFEVYYLNTLVNTFGFDMYLDGSGYYEQHSQYDADVNDNITFKIKYNNQNAARDIYVNYVLNELKA